MFKSIHQKKLSYTNKVVEHIQHLILDGELKAGEKLPAERELAQLMDVSRPTIREAYKILSALGFVHIKHGQGVYILDHKERMQELAASFFNKKESIQELFEMRKVLESQAAYWGAERATAQDLERLITQANENYRKVIEEEVDIDFLEQADHDFHRLVAECTHNQVYMSVMNNLIGLLKTVRMHTLQIPGRPLLSLKEHQQIAQAMVEKNPHKAQQLMTEHVASVEETLTSAFEE